MIKKAVLKIGNKTLNEITSWDKLFAIKSALIKNENNKEREQFTTGRFMANQFLYDEGSDVKSADYGLDNGLDSGLESAINSGLDNHQNPLGRLIAKISGREKM